mmetsp:Transcript_8827/g.20414  ORF Transcript_8827/g.20414 Transcript_8827/m.20414 type:complete len:257 (-) Transcript_8827:42-812(-)
MESTLSCSLPTAAALSVSSGPVPWMPCRLLHGISNWTSLSRAMKMTRSSATSPLSNTMDWMSSFSLLEPRTRSPLSISAAAPLRCRTSVLEEMNCLPTVAVRSSGLLTLLMCGLMVLHWMRRMCLMSSTRSLSTPLETSRRRSSSLLRTTNASVLQPSWLRWQDLPRLMVLLPWMPPRMMIPESVLLPSLLLLLVPLLLLLEFSTWSGWNRTRRPNKSSCVLSMPNLLDRRMLRKLFRLSSLGYHIRGQRNSQYLC